MKATIGTILFVASIAATIVLGAYGINFLWLILFIAIGFLGFGLIKSSAKQRMDTIKKEIDQNLEKIKKTGEAIQIEFENCEFKDISYSHEVVDTTIPSAHTWHETTRTENVTQSALIYYHRTEEKVEKFISPFPCSADALKVYALQHKIVLYVDRLDRGCYFFDLKD